MNELIFLNIPELENNIEYIFSLFKNNENTMTEFYSLEGKDPVLSVLKINDNFLNSVIKDIVKNVEFNSRIFKHHKSYEHSIHKDVEGIKCALNFILKGYNSPIIFYDDNKKEIKKYYYRCGLINTEKYHSVPSSYEDRIFLRFGFYNSFDEIKKILKKYESNNV